ncbi:glycine-rich domain-containing protein [Krasilnikovia sp. MM14-A1259]|uniref:glycine-rich domain-containing protein n=1 Tax=Krasilnikovia sp. MM14-A1259 TaxID=3373539 RepID=UPI00399CD3BA
MSAMVLGSGTTSQRKAMIVDGITFDTNAGLPAVIDSIGYADAGTVYQNCRFTGGGLYLSLTSTHDSAVESCDFFGDGIARVTCVSIGGGSRRLRIRNNYFHYIENGVIVDTGTGSTRDEEYIFADSVIEKNRFNMGWWLTPTQLANSGGTVSYTSTVLTDSAANFPALSGTGDYVVRIMTSVATGSGAGVTYPRIELVDTGANFVAAGIVRGDIVRVGTAFAVVANVRSATNLAVEEWLDDSTRARVAVPAATTAYTVYHVVLGVEQSNTSTTITVTRWFDLTGAAVTPSAGTRYELLWKRPNYAIHSEVGTRNILVDQNILSRQWSDGISMYGPGVRISGNTIRDGEDMGITTNGQSIVIGNMISGQGAGGIFTAGNDSVIESNALDENQWVNPDTRGLGDIILWGTTVRNVIRGNTCRASGTRAQTRHGIVLFGDGVTSPGVNANVIEGNEVTGHTTADYKVDQTVTAGVNDFEFAQGTYAVGGGSAPQRLRMAGTGSPSGVVTAAPGSTYRRLDGGVGTTFYVNESGGTSWTGQAGIPSDVQVFTSSGTWTMPTGAKAVKVTIISGGGGGGSGRRGAAGTVRCGGGGGGAGGVTYAIIPASAISSPVTITVGSGGAGGAAQTANDTDGNNGVNGGLSAFGSNLRAQTGASTRGSGGTASSGTGGSGAVGNLSGSTGGPGGSASATGGAGTAGTSGPYTAGGGSGGGITSGNSASAGGNGGQSSTISASSAPAGGVVDSTPPGAGFSQAANSGLPGTGGGGGAGSITTTAQDGAAGGIYGAGGGGGGASLNGNNSGAGGAGGNGIITVITEF